MDPVELKHEQDGHVTIVSEQETRHGWAYVVSVKRGDREHEHEVTLHHADHDHWTGGRMAPSQVVRVLVAYAIAHRAGELPARFDASTVRRWLPRVDEDFRAGM